jgi:hypothetical protein
MAEPRKRVTYLCEWCGSSDVVKDARATWDVHEQEWALAGYYDSAECEACERETKLIEVELAPAPQA